MGKVKTLRKSDEGRRVRATVFDPDLDTKDQRRDVFGTVCSVLSSQFTMDDDDGRHWWVSYSDDWGLYDK